MIQGSGKYHTASPVRPLLLLNAEKWRNAAKKALLHLFKQFSTDIDFQRRQKPSISKKGDTFAFSGEEVCNVEIRRNGFDC